MKQVVGLPDKIRDEVFETVYKMADEHKYIAKGRVENGLFMNRLVQHSEVGGKLADFMNKGHIKTYIKDTILNRYAKVRKALPQDVVPMLSSTYLTKIHEIEYVPKDHLSFHRTENDKYLIVARVNYLKWETAIRKIALYAASKTTAQFEKLDLDLVIIVSHCLIENRTLEKSLPQIKSNPRLPERGKDEATNDNKFSQGAT